MRSDGAIDRLLSCDRLSHMNANGEWRGKRQQVICWFLAGQWGMAEIHYSFISRCFLVQHIIKIAVKDLQPNNNCM